MVKEIRIYVEGGGDDKNTKIPLRKGFDGFFSELKLLARNNKIKWYTIACGSRESAFYEFLMAKQSHTHAFNILLVDSENPVTTLPWQHLKSQDGWNLCQDHEENCHVMVQVMESWFMADVDSLKNFYGTGFRGKSIPKVHDVETIDKEKVLN
ncbi:MAG: DUF4276 family protein [Candidatus Latescibacteria bacterium]|nr:DUF4276 family protein [Candidatus Latescibacterota bacterium]